MKEPITTAVMAIICLALLTLLVLSAFSGANQAGYAYRSGLRDCDSLKTAKIEALTDSLTILRAQLDSLRTR